jgi:hypothetical protein
MHDMQGKWPLALPFPPGFPRFRPLKSGKYLVSWLSAQTGVATWPEQSREANWDRIKE